MRRCVILLISLFLAALMFGCADPAANKPKATVANAEPEKNSSQPAASERLAITPENSKVEFVAAKVTRSHNGSFKRFSGAIDLVPNSLPDSRVTIDIQPDSVVTDEDWTYQTPEDTRFL